MIKLILMVMTKRNQIMRVKIIKLNKVVRQLTPFTTNLNLKVNQKLKLTHQLIIKVLKKSLIIPD